MKNYYYCDKIASQGKKQTNCFIMLLQLDRYGARIYNTNYHIPYNENHKKQKTLTMLTRIKEELTTTSSPLQEKLFHPVLKGFEYHFS